VIPVYSSELSSDGTRGQALAQEFQMNIFSLLMIWGAAGLGVSFLLLTLLGGLTTSYPRFSSLAFEIPGSLVLYVATAIFGICWLSTIWLIPTEIYPGGARAQCGAISVIIWGLANFAVTLLTPIGFDNLKYWLFLILAVTNTFARWWTWSYMHESGGRNFEINQEFFEKAREKGTWVVAKVDGGKYHVDENKPLLGTSYSVHSCR
jgi:Sugar (and other) transporter